MKARIIFGLMLCLGLTGIEGVYGQEQANDSIYSYTETKPGFPGGETELFKFLVANIEYPAEALEQGIEGRVICQFVVEKDGSVSNIKVVRTPSELLNEESVRVLGMMPQWTPGTMNGQAVRTRFIVPVIYKLPPAAPPQEPAVEEANTEILEKVEKMPEFPGGQEGLIKYLSETVQYPIIAMENGIEGRVYCQFVVEKDGRISNVVVIKSGGDASLDKEAVRVIRSMPDWKPGIKEGRPVRVRYTIPINFKLGDVSQKKKKKK